MQIEKIPGMDNSWIAAGVRVILKRGVSRGIFLAGKPQICLQNVPLDLLIDMGKTQYEYSVMQAVEDWQEKADLKMGASDLSDRAFGRIMNRQCRVVRKIMAGWV